jgi:hypothetical protein
VEIDREIPPALYKAVVEVFVWLAKNEDTASAKKTYSDFFITPPPNNLKNLSII